MSTGAKPLLSLVKTTTGKPDPSTGKLRQWFDEFIAAKRAAVSPKTITKYCTAIEPYIAHVGEHYWPPTRFDVIDYLSTVEERTSAMTKHVYWSSLRVWLNYIDGLGGFEGRPNPADELRDLKLSPKEPKPKPKGVRPEHLERLFNMLDHLPATLQVLRDRMLIKFIWRTGARSGEACGLRRDQLNLDAQEAVLSAEDTKDREERKLVFGRRLAEELAIYLKVLDDHGYTTPWIFPSARGKKKANSISVDGARQMFQRRCGQAGIPRYTIHELRHTFVKDAIHAKKNPDSIRRQLGHSDMRMTLYYGREFDDGQYNDFCDFGDSGGD